MKDRIDPLIAERAPWLFRSDPLSRLSLAVMNRVLGYEECLRLGAELEPLPTGRIMDRIAGRIARRVEHEGLGNIPRSGPAIVVCNHPTGIADGVILHSLLSVRRPDLFIYANSDILRVLPQMAELIAPVEWREERRSRAHARETMAYTRRAVEAGRLGVIFPSGRLAHRRGLRLHERPWMASAASIARRFDLPVIPVNIRARNSALFYLLDAIHPTLRDITLFHETLNKDRQRFALRAGAPIPAAALPANPDEAIEVLRDATLALGRPVRGPRRANWPLREGLPMPHARAGMRGSASA